MTTRLLFWTTSLLFSGCAAMSQDPKTALVRDPGNRTYNPPVSISSSAKELWEYALLSENAYTDGWSVPTPKAGDRTKNNILPRSAEKLEITFDRCPAEGKLPLSEWRVWDDFPSETLRAKARDVGLYMEVWEKRGSPLIVAVVFRGTEFFSWSDWISNFRWFNWLLRLLPAYKDQYTVVAQETSEEVLANLKKRIENGRDHYKNVRIITAGHSLGGGLAQHLAHSLPEIRSSDGTLMPRVSNVYAFDPSPVTGWYSVKTTLRTLNAKELRIDRIFEHGEILAYPRLLLSYVNPPSVKDPAIRQIRYNFVESINPFSNHSMRVTACALLNGAVRQVIQII
jgi:hypothetical protein